MREERELGVVGGSREMSPAIAYGATMTVPEFWVRKSLVSVQISGLGMAWAPWTWRSCAWRRERYSM